MLLFRLPRLRRCVVMLMRDGVLPKRAMYLVRVILQGMRFLTGSLSSASPGWSRREPVLCAVRRRATCSTHSLGKAMLARPEDLASEGLGCNKFVSASTPVCTSWRCRFGDLVEF